MQLKKTVKQRAADAWNDFEVCNNKLWEWGYTLHGIKEC